MNYGAELRASIVSEQPITPPVLVTKGFMVLGTT